MINGHSFSFKTKICCNSVYCLAEPWEDMRSTIVVLKVSQKKIFRSLKLAAKSHLLHVCSCTFCLNLRKTIFFLHLFLIGQREISQPCLKFVSHRQYYKFWCV